MSTPTATVSEKSYTSSVSDDSSYLTWIKHYTKNGAFSILYAMVDGNIFPKIFIIISTIIEFIELISFAFYRDYFPWPKEIRFMSKLYMIINQTPLQSYPIYLIFFWISQSIFYLAIVNTFFMAFQFHKKNYRFIFPIKTLRIFVAGLVTFLVIPLVSLWSISFNCRSGHIIHFPIELECYGTQNLIIICFSIVSLLLLIPYASMTCVNYFEMNPCVTNTYSRMNARYELCLLWIKILLTLVFQFIYSSYIALSIILFISIVFIFILSLIMMPFYNHRMNQLRTGILGMTLWASICLLIVVRINNPNNIITMIIFFIGLLPSFVLGGFIIEYRKKSLLKQVEIFKKDKENWKGLKFSLDYEIVSRYLLGDLTKNDEETLKQREQSIEVMNELYIHGIKKLPNSSTLLKSYCYFLKIHKKDQAQSHLMLDRIKQTKPWWDIKFFVYHQERSRERENEAIGVGGGNKFKDFMVYVEFKRLCSLSRKYHISALRSIHKFWTIAASKNAKQFTALSRQGAQISRYEDKANSYYKRLLEMHPNSSRIMRDYAIFVEDVMNDKDVACDLLDRAAKIEEENSMLSHPPLPPPLLKLDSDLSSIKYQSTKSLNIVGEDNEEIESTLENLPELPAPTASFHRSNSSNSSTSTSSSSRTNSSNSNLYISKEQQQQQQNNEIEMHQIIPSQESTPSLRSISSQNRGGDGAGATTTHVERVQVETKMEQQVKKQYQPIRRLHIILICATIFFVVCTMSIFTHLYIRLDDTSYAVQRLRVTGSYVVTASNIAFYLRSSQVAAQSFQKSNDPKVFATALNQSMTLERRSVQLLNLHNAIYYAERTIYNYDRDHYKLVTGHPVTFGIDTGARIFNISEFNKTRYETKRGSSMYDFYHEQDIQSVVQDRNGNIMASSTYSIYDIIPDRVSKGIELARHLPNDSYWQSTNSNNDDTFKWIINNTKNLATGLNALFNKWLTNTQYLMTVVMLVNVGITLGVIILIIIFNVLFIMPVVNLITKKKMDILGTFQHVPKNVSERMASISLKKLYLLENELKQQQNQPNDNGTFETPTMIDTSDGATNPSLNLYVPNNNDDNNSINNDNNQQDKSSNSPRKTIHFAPNTENDLNTKEIINERFAHISDSSRRSSISTIFSMIKSTSKSQQPNDLLVEMAKKLTRRMHLKYIIAEVIVLLLIIILLIATSVQIRNIREKTREVYLAEGQAAYIRMILYYAQEIIFNDLQRPYMQSSIVDSVNAMRDDYKSLKAWRENNLDGANYYYTTRDCLRKLMPCLQSNDTYYNIVSQGLDYITEFYFEAAMNLSMETNVSKLNKDNYYWGYISMQSKSDLYDGTDNFAYLIGFELVDQVKACTITAIVLSVIFSFFYVILYFIFFHKFVKDLEFESKNTIAILNMIPNQELPI